MVITMIEKHGRQLIKTWDSIHIHSAIDNHKCAYHKQDWSEMGHEIHFQQIALEEEYTIYQEHESQ